MKILGICGTQKRGKTKSASEWFLNVALKAAQEKGAETLEKPSNIRPGDI